MRAFALLVVALVLSGCVGADAKEATSRPIDPVGGRIDILDVEEALRYDVLAQTVTLDGVARAQAEGALDALLGVYLAKGVCPARQGRGGEPPASPLAHDSFRFPSAHSQLRAHAQLSAGPVLPGEEVHVVWLADADNTLTKAYRCATYRAFSFGSLVRVS